MVLPRGGLTFEEGFLVKVRPEILGRISKFLPGHGSAYRGPPMIQGLRAAPSMVSPIARVIIFILVTPSGRVSCVFILIVSGVRVT